MSVVAKQSWPVTFQEAEGTGKQIKLREHIWITHSVPGIVLNVAFTKSFTNSNNQHY